MARSCRAPIWVCRAPMLKRTLPFSKARARWWDGTPVRESYLGKGRVNTGTRASRPSQHRSRSRTSFPALPPSTHPPKATSSSQKHGENPALHVAEGISQNEDPGRASLPAHPPRFLGLDGKSCTNQWKKTPRLLLGGKKRLSRK